MMELSILRLWVEALRTKGNKSSLGAVVILIIEFVCLCILSVIKIISILREEKLKSLQILFMNLFVLLPFLRAIPHHPFIGFSKSSTG
jgi:hypothetical protein